MEVGLSWSILFIFNQIKLRDKYFNVKIWKLKFHFKFIINSPFLMVEFPGQLINVIS